MKQEDILPSAETYEKEMQYFPWGKTIERVIKFVTEKAPQDGRIIDLMCGPGFLLKRIAEKRSDLDLIGVDINQSFIDYARNEPLPAGYFVTGDVLSLPANVIMNYDVVICTGGLHHLSYERQPVLLDVIAGLMKEDGVVIIAEPCLPGFWDEESRKLKAVEFGSSYIREVIAKKAPEDVLMAAIDIMRNDIMGLEFKRSIRGLARMLDQRFHIICCEQVWPSRDGYECGDCYFILEKKLEREERK